MSDDEWKTLRVPEAAYDAAKAQKKEHDRTWGEQVVRPEGETEELTATVTPEIDVEALVAALEPLLSETATEADIRELKVFIDQLPDRTADEVEHRFG